jgi:hypothetical protein
MQVRCDFTTRHPQTHQYPETKGVYITPDTKHVQEERSSRSGVVLELPQEFYIVASFKSCTLVKNLSGLIIVERAISKRFYKQKRIL